MTVSRRSFLYTLPALASPPAIAQRRKPNVVLFLTDDHGPWATPVSGCPEIRMPAVEEMAKTGVRFSNAFAATPVCSPSRMTLMTGLLPCQHGVQDWLQPVDSFGPQSRYWLKPNTTWSEALAQNGYTLGMAGKWHMGHDDRSQAGFSFWATVPGGGGPYKDPVFVKNGERTPSKGFKTDLVGDFAVEFLDSRKTSKDPFALYVPFYAPHTPYDYQPEEYRKPYFDSQFSCYPDLPPHPWQNSGLARNHGNKESMRSYSALITGVDANVKRVMDKLRQMGAEEDTVVIFTADQGWNAGHHGLWGKGNGTVPFNMYEESIGVPMVWRHPGRIGGGRVEAGMVSHYDFMPTLLDYLGIAHRPQGFRAGTSYSALLRGERKDLGRESLFFEYGGVRAVRTRTHKLVRRETGENELWDLENDPGETRNLWDAPAAQGVKRRLDAALAGEFKKAGAPGIEQWKTTTLQNLPTYRRAVERP